MIRNSIKRTPSLLSVFRKEKPCLPWSACAISPITDAQLPIRNKIDPIPMVTDIDKVFFQVLCDRIPFLVYRVFDAECAHLWTVYQPRQANNHNQKSKKIAKAALNRNGQKIGCERCDPVWSNPFRTVPGSLWLRDPAHAVISKHQTDRKKNQSEIPFLSFDLP